MKTGNPHMPPSDDSKAKIWEKAHCDKITRRHVAFCVAPVRRPLPTQATLPHRSPAAPSAEPVRGRAGEIPSARGATVKAQDRSVGPRGPSALLSPPAHSSGATPTKGLTACKVRAARLRLGQRALHGLLEVLPQSLVLCVHGVDGARRHRLRLPEGREDSVFGRLGCKGPDRGSWGTLLLGPRGQALVMAT